MNINNQGMMIQNVNGREQQLGWAAQYDGEDADIRIAKQDPGLPPIQYTMHLTRDDLRRLVSSPVHPSSSSLHKRLEQEFFGSSSSSRRHRRRRNRRRRTRRLLPDTIESPTSNDVLLQSRRSSHSK